MKPAGKKNGLNDRASESLRTAAKTANKRIKETEMKKALALLLAAAMVFSLTACGDFRVTVSGNLEDSTLAFSLETNIPQEEEEEPETIEESEYTEDDFGPIGGGMLAGGWAKPETYPAAELTDADLELFDAFQEGFAGMHYEPVAKLMERDNTYIYLAAGTMVTAYPVTGLYIGSVTVLEDGYDFHFNEISYSNILAASEGSEDLALVSLQDPLEDGFVFNEELSGVTLEEGAMEAFEKATQDLDGASYLPLGVIGTQVVAGLNYAVLTLQTLTDANATKDLKVMTIYRDLGGNAEITNVYDVYCEPLEISGPVPCEGE